MKKYLKVIVITFLILIILSMIGYVVLKVNAVKDEHVKEMIGQKRYALTEEVDIDKIAKNIPLLDYALEYDSYTIDTDNQRLYLNYRLKDGMKRTDIYYDNVKYNSEIYFALLRTLKEVRLQVTFINDANEEEVASYSHFQDAQSYFIYDDNRDDFEKKFVYIMNKYVEGYSKDEKETKEEIK